jgi:hypothetical protein
MLAISAVTEEVTFSGDVLVSPLNISILFFGNVLNHVLLVKEVRLSC